MKKNIMVLCLLLLVFIVACNRLSQFNLNNKNVIESESILPTLPLQNSLPPVVISEVVFAAIDWIEAYFKIMETESITHIQLIDIDFDGIPELFFSTAGTSNSWIVQGYSFKDGSISEILIPDEFMPTTLELYRNKETNQYTWLASGMFRDVSRYSYIWYEIDFSNFEAVKKVPFFGWREALSGEGTDSEIIYTLVGQENEDHPISKVEIDGLKIARFSKYEQIKTMHMFSFTKEFIVENQMDKELFYAFARLYEEAHLELYNNDLLSILAIDNNNLYHGNQKSNYQLSLVKKTYSRFDEVSDVDINLAYVQINRFHNQEIQAKINEAIKADVFFDWGVETAENITLDVYQNGAVYKDYLSISKWSSHDIKDAAYPWSSVSGMTFHMNTGESVHLTDLIIIDDRLKEKIFAGDFISDRFSHQDCLEYGFYEGLFESMQSAANHTNSKSNFYLTETNMHFILGVPHVMGDYLIFRISYQDLEEVMYE